MSKQNKSTQQANPPTAFPYCGTTSFSRVKTKTQREIRGETFMVGHHSWRCKGCSKGTLRKEEVNEVLRATVRAYQIAHELLTADEIRNSREALHWSQQKLADETRLGSATIKRLEGGGVIQTPANDYAIREALSGVCEYDHVFTLKASEFDILEGWKPDDEDGEAWKDGVKQTVTTDLSDCWEELQTC